MPATLLLLAVNVGVFLVMAVGGVSLFEPSPLDLIAWGGLYGPLTIGHEWWRMVTSTFLHVGLLHLALNMACLWSLGPAAERQFGAASYLAGYLIAGVGGATLSLLVHSDQVGAGASGAIFGVAGRLLADAWVLHRQGSEPGLVLSRGELVKFLGANLVFGLVYPGVDAAAHVGGLIVGLVSGMVPSMRRSDRPAWGHWAGLAVSTALVAPGVETLARRHPVSEKAYAETKREVVQEKAMLALVDRLRAAVKRQPDSVQAYIDLAHAEVRTGDYEAAERALRRGLEQVPEDYALLRALGGLEMATQQYDSSVDAYKRAADRYPDSADARVNLASAYNTRAIVLLRRGDSSGAAADLRRILELDIDSTLKRTVRGQLDELEAGKRTRR
jgi:membrane associated rhomboid family serine protease/Tfp pilus assembly protein PilF